MGRNLRGVLISLFAIVLTIVPVSVSAQSTMLVFQSEPGDFIGQGVTATYTPATSQTFTVERNARNGVSVRIQGPSLSYWWSLDFVASNNVPLTVGYYPGALRYPFAALTSMDISGSGRGCNTLTGRFLVRELVYGAGNEVVKAAIDAEQHCEDNTPGLFAALRYNSSVPTDLFPGGIGKYAISITPSAGGVVSGDGIACGGALAACSVVFGGPTTATLTAIPNAGYMFTGWTGACSGGETTNVNVNMVRDCAATFDTIVPTVPRTRLVTSSEAGDWVGQGQDQVFSPLNSIWQTQVWDNGSLNITVRGAGSRWDARWSLIIKPPANLVFGQWHDATRFGDGGLAGLDVSGDGHGCNQVTGRYRVQEWRVDPVTRALKAVALDFEQHCGGPTAPLLTGTLQYQATFEVQTTCTTPDPFAGLGGGTCNDGGWLPPGLAPPQAPPPPPPPSTPPPPPPVPSTCAGPDPFAALGGGVCHNGGWLPPGMVTSQPVTPPPAPPTPPPPPPATPSTCPSADPFAALGGGVCYNGGWLPPGMVIPDGPPSPPVPAPPPAPSPAPTGECTTPDPFSAIGGGTCHRGGWLPPGMPIPGGG